MVRAGRAALAAVCCFGLSLMGSGQVAGTPPVASASPSPSPAPAAKGLQVIYTGNMFGYFRLPDEQKKEDNDCPDGRKTDGRAEIEGEANEEAKTFFSALPKDRHSFVLVGMGENFSPELYSRTIADGTRKESRDRYYWDFVNGTRFYMDEELPHPPHYDHLMAEITRGLGRIPVDNVACFLSLAGYTAIVPGKHDFYFGPEYLRYLARLLASPADNKSYSPVQMLGANLVIQTTIANAAKRIPYRDKKALNYSDDPGNIKFGLGDGAAVLPWLQKIRVDVSLTDASTPSDPPVSICPVPSQSHDPDDASVPGRPKGKGYEPCTRMNVTESKDDAGKPVPPESGKTRTLSYSLPDGPKKGDVAYTFLTPGNDYLLCAEVKRTNGRETRPYCQHLSVYAPFFNYPFPVPAPGQDWEKLINELDHPLPGAAAYKPAFKSPLPYVVKDFAGGEEKVSVAVFGVVDQDLTEHVGKLNYAWVNLQADSTDQLQEHKSYSTEVKVIDPVEALRQQLEYFGKEKPGFSGFKILLAQMPAYKARLLAAAMPGEFNLIIAQAEIEDATRPGTTSIKVPEAAEQANAKDQPVAGKAPTFVAVPAPFYDERDPARLRLQVRSSKLKLSGCDSDCPKKESTWSLETVYRLPVDPDHPSPETGIEAAPLQGQPNSQLFCDPEMVRVVHNTLRNVRYTAGEGEKTAASSPAPVRDPSCKAQEEFSKFRKLALVVMQMEKQADIAILQDRDVFQALVKSGVTLQSANLQEMLDRIFWKGDFLLKVPVRGDVLKKIMQRSKQFDEEDKASLSLYHERRRGLVTLGIFQDRVNSTLIVNGDAVDDNKVYTIATSDYMGLGDTGYSDLLATPVGKPITPADIKSVQYISEVVCREMAVANDWPADDTCHSYELDASEYFAALEQSPFDTTPGFTPLRHLMSWARIQKRRPGLYSSNKVGTLEQSFQQRPVWSLSLSKLAAGFTMNQHNHGTEANVANLFGGITTVPVVSAANTNTTSLDTSVRFLRSSQHLEAFAQNDASYARQLTRQNNANNTDQATQLKNQLSLEGGVLPRFYPHTKEIPALKELISVRLETQFSDPLTNFKLASGGVLPFVGDRTETLLGKYGLRFENQKSWIEGGYQAGELISSPVQFVFNPGTATEVTCSATNASQPPPTAQTPQSQLPLATCVKNNSGNGGPIRATSQVVEATRNHFVQGLFLNFKMNMPLPGHDKLAYVMENKGQLFFNRGNDVSVETRLYEDWTHSLVVPLFGNFSFVPKVEIIAYQNKVDGNFFWTYQPTVSLQYSLDWHTGLGWKRALQYQNPQVAAKAAQ